MNMKDAIGNKQTNKKNYFIYPGALCFGLGIGGGILERHVIFGVVMFVIASTLFLLSKIIYPEEENEEDHS